MQVAKGYYVACGYMGYVAVYNKYMLFASEADYLEFISE